jgi:hypothetical protein
MICIDNLKKNWYIFIISIAKPKNFVVFAFTYVSRSPALFNGDFFMNLVSVDSDEAMKRLTVHRTLNASHIDGRLSS